MKKIQTLLHRKNPYLDFPITKFKYNCQGWESDSKLFELVIKKYQPKIVFEVGSWMGASAIHMANLAKQQKIRNFQLICIDTWLGSAEHRSKSTPEPIHATLNCVNGYPSLYYQFLANVIHSKNEKSIIPLPLDSRNASVLLAQENIMADAIYIDAGHDYISVKNDLENYWPLLRKGGVFFGDDFSIDWSEVIWAVSEFSKAHGVTAKATHDRKWYIEKP